MFGGCENKGIGIYVVMGRVRALLAEDSPGGGLLL
jgi:hypothetical protein